MTEEETVSARKIGSFAIWVFVIVCAYFGYAQYMLYRSIPFAIDLIGHFTVYQRLIESPWWMAMFYSSELIGGFGGVLRSAASFFAIYSAWLFWRKREEALQLIRGKVGVALVLEAGYFWP